MKLWTKKLADKAKKYPLYSQEGKGMDAKVHTAVQPVGTTDRNKGEAIAVSDT